MNEEFPIYFHDLTEEAQNRYLKFAGTTEEDNNFEIAPIAFTPLPVNDKE